MKNVQIPGAAWVIGLAMVNALAMALSSAFPGAIWVPLAVDLLAVVAKAIQVYGPKTAAPAAQSLPSPANWVPAQFQEPTKSPLRSFLLG